MLTELTYRKLKNKKMGDSPKHSIVFPTNVMETDIARIVIRLGDRRPIN
jgi:energy-converting hydrogenase Eha subunit A